MRSQFVPSMFPVVAAESLAELNMFPVFRLRAG